MDAQALEILLDRFTSAIRVTSYAQLVTGAGFDAIRTSVRLTSTMNRVPTTLRQWRRNESCARGVEFICFSPALVYIFSVSLPCPRVGDANPATLP